ncbi:MAG: cell surface protein SprA [Bacteroidales bacterium]
MLVRNASLSYSEGNGTVLPGYMHSPNLFGINFATNSPGFAFVFGGQPDIRKLATDGHWLTTDSLMNSAFESRYNQTVNFRATVEPFRDFRIDITANRNYTQNFTEYFRSDANGVMHHYSPQTTGSFSMTFVGLSSFFSNSDQVFSEFREVRKLLASRISENNPNSNGRINPETGYPVGYGELSQDVLTAAFLAAYGGRNPDKMDVSSQFPKIPLPNWRLNYTGFTKIKGVNKIFQSLSLLHTYTSSYSVGNYTTNILYTSDAEGNPNTLNTLGNFIPTKEFAQVSLSEQFNPLIGFDMTLKNSLLLKVEYKKSRNVAMSFSNNQITESSSDEFVFSTGYRFKDLKIGFVFSGMKRQVVSDLNLTAGFGLKKNLTLLRKIDEDTKQISAGMLTITINVAADYQISSMVGLRLYYDQVINRPELNNQYDNMNFETGISVRLMLTQ